MQRSPGPSAQKSQWQEFFLLPWGAMLAPGLFLCLRLCSDVELWFSMWPEIWFKHFSSHLYLLWFMSGIQRVLLCCLKVFANKVGSVPPCKPLKCILQEACLMRKNSMDWRERKRSKQNLEESHWALCLDRITSAAFNLCKLAGFQQAEICLCHCALERSNNTV